MAVWMSMVRSGNNYSYSPIQAKIILNAEKPFFKVGERIHGKVVLSLKGGEQSYEFYDAKVELECFALVEFQQRFDGRLTNRSKRERLLEEPWTRIPLFERVGHLKKLTKSTGRQQNTSSPETMELPFSIILAPYRMYPGSFNGMYGKLVYHIAFHLQPREDYEFECLSTKPVRIKSHLDLGYFPDPVQTKTRFTFEKSLSKSMFSKKTPLNFKLTVDQIAFIENEELAFQLLVDNSAKQNLTRMSVALIQRVIFEVEPGTVKSIVTVYALKASTNVNLEGETFWEDVLTVPKGLYPTFQSAISHLYFIKVEIFMDEYVPSLKGEFPVTIGTARGGIKMTSSTLTSPTGDFYPEELEFRGRSNSMPPSYSQLSSRRASAASVETLPPAYDLTLMKGTIDEMQEPSQKE